MSFQNKVPSYSSAPVKKKKGKRTREDMIASILASISDLISSDTDELDLKMTDTVIKEMTQAFKTFIPFRNVKKLTMFGSARTKETDPLYQQARRVAEIMASRGWMVVTGAGPGIMAAGVQGAGRDMSIGVNIRLPHEQHPNAFIATDPKLVEMRYFFSRKLMLIKESDAYIFLPGGFGTMDEAFELLTLLQTGKAQPAPTIFLEVPGDTYWHSWKDFVLNELLSRNYISDSDGYLFHITESADDAVAHLMDFYSNYQSLRWVKDILVLRVKEYPDDDKLKLLNEEFKGIITKGSIQKSEPLLYEVQDNDQLHLKRLTLYFDKIHYGDLHRLIWAINGKEITRF
jgi:uncharacterized protein (TIGR00730 family)